MNKINSAIDVNIKQFDDSSTMKITNEINPLDGTKVALEVTGISGGSSGLQYYASNGTDLIKVKDDTVNPLPIKIKNTEVAITNSLESGHENINTKNNNTLTTPVIIHPCYEKNGTPSANVLVNDITNPFPVSIKSSIANQFRKGGTTTQTVDDVVGSNNQFPVKIFNTSAAPVIDNIYYTSNVLKTLKSDGSIVSNVDTEVKLKSITGIPLACTYTETDPNNSLNNITQLKPVSFANPLYTTNVGDMSVDVSNKSVDDSICVKNVVNNGSGDDVVGPLNRFPCSSNITFNNGTTDVILSSVNKMPCDVSVSVPPIQFKHYSLANPLGIDRNVSDQYPNVAWGDNDNSQLPIKIPNNVNNIVSIGSYALTSDGAASKISPEHPLEIKSYANMITDTTLSQYPANTKTVPQNNSIITNQWKNTQASAKTYATERYPILIDNAYVNNIESTTGDTITGTVKPLITTSLTQYLNEAGTGNITTQDTVLNALPVKIKNTTAIPVSISGSSIYPITYCTLMEYATSLRNAHPWYYCNFKNIFSSFTQGKMIRVRPVSMSGYLTDAELANFNGFELRIGNGTPNMFAFKTNASKRSQASSVTTFDLPSWSWTNDTIPFSGCSPIICISGSAYTVSYSDFRDDEYADVIINAGATNANMITIGMIMIQNTSSGAGDAIIDYANRFALRVSVEQLN